MTKTKKCSDIYKSLSEIKENVSLKNYTSFKIGGRAKYFFVAQTEKDLISAINLAKEINLPFFILGGGSNLLVSDREYKGLVIKTKNEKIKIEPLSSSKKGGAKLKIFCEAGTLFSKLLSESIKNEATGLEWAIGIPGTVAGATRGNAGAFGSSIADSIQMVRVYNVKNRKIKIFKNKDCQFNYRNTIFKKNKDLIIISLTLELKKGKKKDIENKIKEYLDYRKKHQPLNFPSAGSIFLNPKGFSAGQLIEKCGLKGKKMGQAQISKIHANFIVNRGRAKAKDVKKLIKLTKEKAKQKFGIILKEEIEYL